MRPVAEHDVRALAAELPERVVGVHLHHERRDGAAARRGSSPPAPCARSRISSASALARMMRATAPRLSAVSLSIAACSCAISSSCFLRCLGFARSLACCASVSASSCACSASCSSSSFFLSASFSMGAFCRAASCSPTSFARDRLRDLGRVVDASIVIDRDLDVLALDALAHLVLDLVLDLAGSSTCELRVRVAREHAARRAAELGADDLVVVVRADLGIELVELGDDGPVDDGEVRVEREPLAARSCWMSSFRVE